MSRGWLQERWQGLDWLGWGCKQGPLSLILENWYFLIFRKGFGTNLSSVLMKLKFADAMMLRGIVLTEEVWEIIQEKVDDLEGWDKINGMKCSFPQMEMQFSTNGRQMCF